MLLGRTACMGDDGGQPSSPLIDRLRNLLILLVYFLSEETWISFQEQNEAEVLRRFRGERPNNPVNEVYPRGKI
jgi:hypothetical protein